MGYDKFGLDWNVWGTGGNKSGSSSTNPLLDGVGKGWSSNPGNSAVEENDDSPVEQNNGTTARLKNAKFLPDSTTAFNKPCKIQVEIESKTPVTSQVVISLWGKYKDQETNLQHEIRVSPNGSIAEGSLNLYYIDEYYNDISTDPTTKETVEYVAKCSLKGASPVDSEPLVMPLSRNIVMVFEDDKSKAFKKVKVTLKNGDIITSDDSGTIIIPAPEDDSAVEIIKIEFEEEAPGVSSEPTPAQVNEQTSVSSSNEPPATESPAIPEEKALFAAAQPLMKASPPAAKEPATSEKKHYRPGYTGYQPPPSAPDVLDFEETDIILKDLSETEFRKKIVETLSAMDDLGLNRSGGASRSEAYLDMVTWDDAYRKSWKNDNSVNSSSCAMFVRNTWWLCGARGSQLFDENYKGGVITKILDFDTNARKRWGSGFTAKTFFPKIGDVIYLYDSKTNSQHIFTIYEIDKIIEMVNGESVIYNQDRTLASEITFTGIDGGQSDGTGPDSNGTSKSWGCHAIKKTVRKMKLNSGHFMNIGAAWTKPDGSTGRPVNTWIDTWAAKDKFTAKYVQPIRNGVAQANTPTPAPAPAPPVPAAVTPAPTPGDEDFYSWPSMSGVLPDSIINKIIENRTALPDYGDKLRPKTSGFTYGGKKFDPDQLLTKPEEQSNAKLKAVIERLYVEMGGEGGVSAVMTGDSAKFTWGRGLAHGGGLEGPMKYFIEHCPAAKTSFLDHGIILEGKEWKIVDTDGKRIRAGELAIDYLNGSTPAEIKRTLLSAFIKITEDNGKSASTAQWMTFKEQYFYQDKPSDEIINTWSPEAVCYVIHCKAWGTFAGWSRFKSTGGDLKKILRMEVEFTGFNEKRGSYLYVPAKHATKEIYPALTMLLNMGHRHLIDARVVEPVDSPDAAGNGDILFYMDKKKSGAKSEYYLLKSVPSQYDPREEMNVYIAKIQGYSMDALLKELLKMRGTTNSGYNKLKAHRDWYADPSNPKKEKFGLRPLVAMDAILHKNEGNTAAWILDVCKSADISETSCWDQYALIKKTIGIA